MRITLTLFLFLVFGKISTAQHVNVLISAEKSPNEPSIAINEKNPAELVAGANVFSVYKSSDTGKSWTRADLTSSLGVWGDPVILNDTAGSFYFFHLSNPTGSPFTLSFLDRIVCQKLDSFNGTWNDGSYATNDTLKDHDKQWVALDKKKNTIYMTWTRFDQYQGTDPMDSSQILFSRSVDGGASWTEGKRINDLGGDCVDRDSTVEGAVPCVGPNGEVYVTWMNRYGLMFDMSTDGGDTWLPKDVFLDSIPGGWDFEIPGLFRCNGFPFIDCDLSGGQYNSNIYINWSDQRNGKDNTDIWFIKSTDGGKSFSQPKLVNDDLQFDKHQFLTSMTIDQVTGYIYILFYDRRNYNDERTDVYLAVSKDGGNTFKNQKISDAPFIPVGTFFGDYTDITAHNNIIRPVWCNQDIYGNRIYTALIDTSMLFTGIEQQPDILIKDDLVYPNPFTSTTFISFKLRSSTMVSLYVTDMFGRKVEVIKENELLQTGKYVFKFNAAERNIPAGIYYFYLYDGKSVTTKKIIYSK